MLRWARDHGCPWGPETTAAAACGGHALILAYAVANGCPMHDNMCEYAAYGGDVFMLEGFGNKGIILATRPARMLLKQGSSKCSCTSKPSMNSSSVKTPANVRPSVAT